MDKNQLIIQAYANQLAQAQHALIESQAETQILRQQIQDLQAEEAEKVDAEMPNTTTGTPAQ